MRVVFLGASEFGLKCLQAIQNLSEICELKGVVTAPKKFTISYNQLGVVNVLHADIVSYCKDNNIPYKVLEKGMHDEGLLDTVSGWNPDFFIVVGWYHMLPKQWLSLAPAYGLHASLLPDYSGGAPLVWAMINGEIETGISLFQFDTGVDNGPILGQLSTPIYADENIASLYSRIEKLGLELINIHVPKLVAGNVNLIIQDESKRRIYPQRKPKDGLINWNLPAQKIYDFIRAQSRPYPGAFTIFNEDKISIWRSNYGYTKKNLIPGEIIAIDENMIRVGCGSDSVLDILEASLNDQEITINEIVNSLNLTSGSNLSV